jgi:hypothetical protein
VGRPAALGWKNIDGEAEDFDREAEATANGSYNASKYARLRARTTGAGVSSMESRRLDYFIQSKNEAG